MKRTAIISAMLLILSVVLGQWRVDERAVHFDGPTETTVETFFSDTDHRTALISEVPAAVASVPQAWSVNAHSSNSHLNRNASEAVHRTFHHLGIRSSSAFAASVPMLSSETSAIEYYVITLRKIII